MSVRLAWVRRTSLLAGVAVAISMTPTAALPAAPGPVGDLHVESVDVASYPKLSAIIAAPRDLTSEVMSRGSFTVLEGTAGRPATAEALPVADLAVVLMIDTSGSMKGAAMLSARHAAQSFAAAMPLQVRIAVVGFGTVPTVYSPFSTDRTKTSAALGSLKVRGETSLHDALITGSKLFGSAAPTVGARRVIVLLTDGGDTASKATIAQAAKALRDSGVELSAIALTTRESDTAALTVLATSVRGAVVPAADAAALNNVFSGVANTVLRHYKVSWTSTAHGSTDVTMELQVDGRAWRAVRATAFPIPAAAGPTTIASIAPIPSPTPTPIPALVVHRAGPADSGRRWLFSGLGAGFLALLLGLGVLLWPRPPRRRLAVELGMRPQKDLSGFSKSLIEATRAYFQRHGRGQRLAGLLERAGMTIDAPTAAVLAGVIGVCGFAVGLALDGIFGATMLGCFAVACCYLAVKSRADRRSKSFRDQFESSLQMIINSLKSGYGVSQAIETVARESESPTSDEFRRIVTESALGMDQIRALESCGRRTDCEELLWVAESMEVNRDVGGNLSEVLSGIANTVRSRIRLARHVHTVSAEGRISAKILFIMPLLAMAFQLLVNRPAFSQLFHGTGLVFLICAGISMLVGYFWTTRIVRVKF